MAVLRLDLAYEGTGFRGFARQPGLRTVQGELESVLRNVTGGVPRLSVAGRTDAGVHATGQVVSFEAEADPDRLGRALNALLPPDVAVLAARRSPRGFDARRSATAREYRYVVRTDTVRDPFTARYEWHRPGDYSIGQMRRAAASLEGEHDFTSFCRPAGPDASRVRRLERLAVRRAGPVIEIRARADGFLHQMVRSLVGTLVRVGEGRMDAGSMPAVLESRSRAAAGPVAPPHGLTLVRVLYRLRRRP